MTDRSCACGAPISKSNKSGRCRTCSNAWEYDHRTRVCKVPGCDTKIRDNNESGMCPGCSHGRSDAMEALKLMNLTECFQCGEPLTKRNTNGLCAGCKGTESTVTENARLTDIVQICEKCGEPYRLRTDQEPGKRTKWCEECRTIMADDSRGYLWVGGGEVGW